MKNPTLSVADVEAAFSNDEQAAANNESSAWTLNELNSIPSATFIPASSGFEQEVSDGVIGDPDARRLMRGALNVALVSHESLQLVMPDPLHIASEVAQIGESSVQSVSKNSTLSEQPSATSEAAQPQVFSLPAVVQDTVLPGAAAEVELINLQSFAETMLAEVLVEDAQEVHALPRYSFVNNQAVGIESVPGAQDEFAFSSAMDVVVNEAIGVTLGDVLQGVDEPVFMEVSDFLALLGGRSAASLELGDVQDGLSDPVGQALSEPGGGSGIHPAMHVAGVDVLQLESEGAKDLY